jgi:D-amino-acid dehydrogenase
MIHLCATEQMLDEVRKEMQLLDGFGVPGRVLDRDELYATEPALKPGLFGAVHFTAEAHAEPLKMVQAFVKSAADRGAKVCERTELIDFDRRGNRIEAVITTRGRLRADHFVLATGSWSPPLGKRLGIRLPIQPAKGYAVIMAPPDPMPTYPAMLDAHKIGVTPRDGSLKLAGTLELAGMDESITRRRVDAIIRNAQKFYHIPPEPKILEIWRGLRPVTPDGLPAIGPAPADRAANLTIAAGHAMLGLTLAPGTAMLVADMIEHKTPQMDPTPFSPSRF